MIKHRIRDETKTVRIEQANAGIGSGSRVNDIGGVEVIVGGDIDSGEVIFRQAGEEVVERKIRKDDEVNAGGDDGEFT